MFKAKEIVDFFEDNKGYVWGAFFTNIIFKFAVGNIFILLLLILFFLQVYVNRKVFFNKCFLPLLIYFSWGSLSILWSTQPLITLSGIGMITSFVLLPLFFSQYKSIVFNDLLCLIKTLSCCLLGYFVIGLINSIFLYQDDGQLQHFFYHDLVQIFNNNAIYISLAVSICILVLLNVNTKKTNLLMLLLSIYLLFLSSKNIIISTGLLSIFFLMQRNKSVKNRFIIITLFAFLLTFLFFIDNPIKDRFVGLSMTNLNLIWYGIDFYDYAFNGVEVRFFQWRVMYEMIINKQVGFLGLGLHNVNYLLEQYFSYYNLYKGYFFINFHNQYLQTLGELGFIGLVLLFFLIIFIFNYVIKKGNLLLIYPLLLIVFSLFTESFLSRQKGILLIIAFFCVCLKYKKS